MTRFHIESMPGQLHGDIRTSVVTVSGGPTLLPAVALADRKDFLVYNPTTNDTVYLGGPSVTSSTGIPVPAGGSFAVQLGRARMYAVASGTNQSVRVMEIS